MTETSESLLEHFRRVRSVLLTAIEGLGDQQMIDLTLDGWSVKDNLAHVAFWDDLRADEVIRMSAGHDSVLRMTHRQDADLNAIAYDLRRHLSLSQVRWELEHSRRRLEDAVSAAPPAALDPSRYGEAGLLSTHDAQHAGYITAWRQRMGY